MQFRSTVGLPKKGKAYGLFMQGNSRCAHGIHLFHTGGDVFLPNNVRVAGRPVRTYGADRVQTRFSCVRADAGTTRRGMEHDVIQ
jgi:hypothetical protein